MSGGLKFDTEKVRMELLPPAALEEIAKVLTFGAKKYASWGRAYGTSTLIHEARIRTQKAVYHIWLTPGAVSSFCFGWKNLEAT